MTLKLKILAVLIGITFFVFIIELVRKRRLREEYSWLWLLTGFSIAVLSLWYDLLVYIGGLLGGVLPSALLFFFGLLFLLLICLYQSITISRMSDQVKVLAQEVAILRSRGSDA
ncbi:MAG: hypothetical protein OHK006_15400 [Thermodesulfovibrionales bacterium]